VGGSSGDKYEDVSNSAEVEQKAKQENNDCENSECQNFIGSQTQRVLREGPGISNEIGGGDGKYEDVSNSAEVEQKADQQNKDCKDSLFCENLIGFHHRKLLLLI
jgi:hypothetical protein